MVFTERVKDALVLPEAFEAVTVYNVGSDASCGIPLIMPVPSMPIDPGGGAALRLSPFGSVGEILYAGIFVPLEFTKVVGAPLFGVINDKVSRTTMTLTSLAMMAAAFGFFGFVTNAFGTMMIAGAFLLGVAESAEAIASQTFLAEQAPAHLRGSSIGVFSFLGTTSLMVINLVGGYLFDKVGFSSPLVMEGVLHLIVLAIAIWVLRPNGSRAA